MPEFGELTISEIGELVAPQMSQDAYINYEFFEDEVKTVFNAMTDDTGMTGEEYLERFWIASDDPPTPSYIPPREISFWHPLYLSARAARRFDFPDTETCPLCLGNGEERFVPGLQCSNCNGRRVQVRVPMRGFR